MHDAPPAMAVPLIVLAVGAVVAGYVGVPHALGGSNRIEQFLEPSFAAHHATGEPGVADQADAAEAGAHDPAGNVALERTLMAVSSVVALAGIAIAGFFFLKNRAAAGQIADRFAGVHRLLVNKYYVDEVYDAALVQPIRLASEEGLWKRLDARGIDAAVNGVAGTVAGLSQAMRRTQTGSVRAYAASLFLGVVLVLGYYLLDLNG